MKPVLNRACVAAVVFVVAAILVPGLRAQPVGPGLAVGDRVAAGAADGLKGIIVKIGGAGDAYYYRGCYAVHFDYETYDPSVVQWTCTNTGSKLFKLGADDKPIAALAAPVVAPPVIPPGAPAPNLAQPHACFSSDPDSLGATAAERGFRSVIRKTFERAAAPGSDGAVTVSFQSFKVGGGRSWTRADGDNFTADQKKPIYALRVVYTTCTDYHTAIDIRQQERNFDCFTSPTGDSVCQISGNTGGMMQDKKQYIPK
ncbi:MAG: hypothetical protein ACHP9S_11500 [Terriglobales bacterium]